MESNSAPSGYSRRLPRVSRYLGLYTVLPDFSLFNVEQRRSELGQDAVKNNACVFGPSSCQAAAGSKFVLHFLSFYH